MATEARASSGAASTSAKRTRRSLTARRPDAAALLGVGAAVAAGASLLASGSVAQAAWLAALPLAVALLLRPDWAVLALVFTTYTRFSNVITEHYGFVWISSFLVGLLVVIAVVRWRFWREPALWVPVPIAILAGYGLLSATSLLYARQPEAVVGWLVVHGKAMIAALATMLLAKGRLRGFAWGVIGGVLFVGTLGALAYATGSTGRHFGGFVQSKMGPIGAVSFGHRLAGPIGDPNYFGALLVFAVPLALERCLRERTPLARGLAGWALVAALLSMYFTASRGAVVALGVVSLAGIWIYRPKRSALILISLALVVSSVFVSQPYLARVGTMLSAVPGIEATEAMDSSIQERLRAWQVALVLFQSHPILGVGAGNFDRYYFEEARLLGLQTNQKDVPAHSLFLEVAAERGLVGVIAFTALLAAAAAGILRAHRAASRSRDADEATLVSAFGCGLLGYLAALLFLHDAFPQFFWLAMAFALAMPRIVAAEPSWVAGRSPSGRGRRRLRKSRGAGGASSGSEPSRPVEATAAQPPQPASAVVGPDRPRSGSSRPQGRRLNRSSGSSTDRSPPLLRWLSRGTWKAWKRLYWSRPGRPDAAKQVLMIVGCQRSGTTMMQTVFENCLDADVYGEFSRLSGGAAGDRLRLRPPDEIRQVIGASRFPLIVMKPLVESQRTRELLGAFPEAKALWMYRCYNAVASSNLRRFGRQNGIRDLAPIIEGRIDDWRAEAVPDKMRAMLQRYFDARMAPHDAAALFWYVRNSHFFRQGLERDPRVLLVEYDAFVRDPVTGIGRIYDFLGRSVPGPRATAVVEDRRAGSGGSVRLSPAIDALCRDLWGALETARRRRDADSGKKHG